MVITDAAAQALTVEEGSERFHTGTSHDAHRLLGVHANEEHVIFRVFAPAAACVRLCGDFNAWSGDATPMQCVTRDGIWEAVLPRDAVQNGQFYKFRVIKDGTDSLFADPYARLMQAPPETASVISLDTPHVWSDGGWLDYRRRAFDRDALCDRALNLYQLDPRTWRVDAGGALPSLGTLAEELAVYVKQMGYTHVELLSVCGGAFALTDDLGTPADFAAFVDRMHEAGVGVVIDWGATVGEELSHEERSTLLSSAAFWCEYYHVDGLRIPRTAHFEEIDAMLAERYPDVLAIPVGGETQSYAADAQALPALRAQLVRMMTLPGKKRTVMGREIGMLCSWKSTGGVDWHLLSDERHAAFQAFVAGLNHFYLENPALWEESFEGFFEPLDVGADLCAYRRRAEGQTLTVLVNTSTDVLRDVALPVEAAGVYTVCFATDEAQTGRVYESIAREDLLVTLAPAGAILLAHPL